MKEGKRLEKRQREGKKNQEDESRKKDGVKIERRKQEERIMRMKEGKIIE